MLEYRPNPEVQCERVATAFKRYFATGDVLWDCSRKAYRWLSANLPATASVLDVGCGAGFGTYLLAPRAVEGLDLDASAIGFARSVYPRISFHQWDIALSVYPKIVDVVVMLEVIEHIDDWQSALENAKASTRDTLVLSTPNRASAVVPDEHPSILAHVREFTPKELVAGIGPGWSTRVYGFTEDNAPVKVVEVGVDTETSPVIVVARRKS